MNPTREKKSMLGITLKNRVRNKAILGRTGMEDINIGHVVRMKDDRWTKKMLE